MIKPSNYGSTNMINIILESEYNLADFKPGRGGGYSHCFLIGIGLDPAFTVYPQKYQEYQVRIPKEIFSRVFPSKKFSGVIVTPR